MPPDRSRALAALAAPRLAGSGTDAQVGVRPGFLVDHMPDGPLKDKLTACETGPFHRTDFDLASRRAAAIPRTYRGISGRPAPARGILECDVTFTKDKQLVCRHAQNDLATTTNILATPLAANCTKALRAGLGRHARLGRMPHLGRDPSAGSKGRRQDGCRRQEGDHARGLHGRDLRH